MSEEEAKPKEAKAPRKPLNLGLIVGAVNMLAILAVLGFLVFTKIIYKRPKITEETERAKLETEAKLNLNAAPRVRAIVKCDPVQANLKPTSVGPNVTGGPPPQLKPHYLNMTIALEIADASFEASVKENMPKFMDELLRVLGETSVDELTTVQGRFILRSRIMGIYNKILQNQPTKNSVPVVTNVYFMDFMIQ